MIEEEKLLIKDNISELQAKELFYKTLKENGIDFDDIDSDQKIPRFMIGVIKNEPMSFNKFNNVIYKLNKNNEFSIIDAMTYITEDWIDEKVLLKCLDEMNHYSLMNAFRQKYKIEQSYSGLNEIFV